MLVLFLSSVRSLVCEGGLSKVEDLPIWAKNPPFPPSQPLDSQTTNSPHLGVHKHPQELKVFFIGFILLNIIELLNIILLN